MDACIFVLPNGAISHDALNFIWGHCLVYYESRWVNFVVTIILNWCSGRARMGPLRNMRARKHLPSKIVFLPLAIILSGCVKFPTHVVSAPPSDYQQRVADSCIAATLRSKASFDPLEISEIKRTILGEPGDWRACIRTRTATSEAPVYFAVFFVGNSMEYSRRSVGIDHCEQDRAFGLLPPAQRESASAKGSDHSCQGLISFGPTAEPRKQ